MLIIPEQTPDENNQIKFEGKTYELGETFVQGRDAKASGINTFMQSPKGVIGLKLV